MDKNYDYEEMYTILHNKIVHTIKDLRQTLETVDDILLQQKLDKARREKLKQIVKEKE